MKRLIVLLLVLTLLYSSASADWDEYSIYPTTKEVFDQIESPYDLINGTYYDETPFFLGYLVAMNIRAEDILENPNKEIEVAMDAEPFFGIAESDDDTALLFVLPQLKKSEKDTIKYKVAYYVTGDDKLYCDPDWIISNVEVYNMLSKMCGNNYRKADSDTVADALTILDSFIIQTFGEEYLEVAESFLVGNRPVNWTKYWSDMWKNTKDN